MATTTTLINAQSIGTGSNIGNGVFATSQTTLAASTTAFYLDCKLVNGATAGEIDQNQKVMVRYSITGFTVTAAEAVLTLGQTAHYVPIIPRSGASKEVIAQSALEPAAADQAKISVWVDAPKFPVAGTLTVNLVEMP